MMAGLRPQFWPTLFAAPTILVLFGLGAWQIQRHFWKEHLIAERAAAVAARVVPTPQTLAQARRLEFHRVTAEGIFLHAKEIYLGASAGAGRIGYQVLTPLMKPSGDIVFINRGFIPAELKNPAKRVAGQIGGTVRIVGFLRLPPLARPNWLAVIWSARTVSFTEAGGSGAGFGRCLRRCPTCSMD